MKVFIRKRLKPQVYSAIGKTKRALWPKKELVDASFLDDIPEPFLARLRSMYSGEPQAGSDGKKYAIDAVTRISPEAGMWLYRLCRQDAAERTLEIGCAYGFSTLYFLAALSQNPCAIHTAIDPWERGAWCGIGAQNAKAVRAEKLFRLIEEKSILAIPRLATTGTLFDVVFIDGNHRFDDVLIDFTLSADVCKIGGHIVLDDMWMPSVRRTVEFIRKNREDFEEIKTPVLNLAVFQKVSEDKRSWDHFREF
jgi:predicted O-methyltransferase YrrM